MKALLIALLVILIGSGCVNKKQEQKIQSLVSPANSPSAEPYLFTDKNGTVYLSWVEQQEANKFWFSRLTEDRWSKPNLIAQGVSWFVNWADYPMISTDGDGNFTSHLLYKSGDGTYAYDVKMTSSDNGGSTWNVPFMLHDDGKQAEHGFVSQIPYGDKIFVTWLDGRNTMIEGMEGMDHHEGHQGAMSLRAAVLDYNGNKINEWELDNKTCDCCQTSAAITNNGPVVVYRDRSDEEIRDMSIVRLVDNKWTEPKSIHNDNWKIAGCPVNGPRIDAEGNNLVVAWYSAATDTASVNVIFSHDGGITFSNPIRVDEGSPIGRVDIALINDKSAMVSWMEGSAIKAVKVFMDGTKGSSVDIALSSESRSSGFPQMTKSGNQLIFAWTDDKEKNIKVARLSLKN